jgi:hypothetical protein
MDRKIFPVALHVHFQMGGKTMASELTRRRLSSKKIRPRKPALRRRKTGVLISPYPLPPRELAGKWVAWSRYEIVASGDKLADVVNQVKSEGIKDASYELLPILESNGEHCQ